MPTHRGGGSALSWQCVSLLCLAWPVNREVQCIIIETSHNRASSAIGRAAAVVARRAAVVSARRHQFVIAHIEQLHIGTCVTGDLLTRRTETETLTSLTA